MGFLGSKCRHDNKRCFSSVVVVVGLVTWIASFPARAEAQEFRIEDANSVPEPAADRLKPRTIAFVDLAPFRGIALRA